MGSKNFRWAYKLKSAKKLVTKESKKKKKTFFALACLSGVILIALQNFYIYRQISVQNYRTIIKDLYGVDSTDYEPYDVDCARQAISELVAAQFDFSGLTDFSGIGGDVDLTGIDTINQDQGLKDLETLTEDIEIPDLSSIIENIEIPDSAAAIIEDIEVPESTSTKQNGEIPAPTDPKQRFVESFKLRQSTERVKFYTDYEAAYEEAVNVLDCGSSCEKGSQWSVIFASNIAIISLLACNMCCVCFGTVIGPCRLLAGFCAVIFFLGHIAIIIVSLVFRFSPTGRLCALSGYSTNAMSTDPGMVTDDWTYEMDGQLIIALAVVQLLGSGLCCFVGIYPLRKRPKFEVTKIEMSVPEQKAAPNQMFALQQTSQVMSTVDHDVSIPQTSQVSVSVSEGSDVLQLAEIGKKKKKKKRRMSQRRKKPYSEGEEAHSQGEPTSYPNIAE